MTYAKAVGLKVVIAIFTLGILRKLSGIYLDVWMSQWTNDHTTHNHYGTSHTVNKNMRLAVYGIVGLTRGI